MAKKKPVQQIEDNFEEVTVPAPLDYGSPDETDGVVDLSGQEIQDDPTAAAVTQPVSGKSNVDKSVVSVDNLIGLPVTQIEFGIGCHLMGQTLTLSSSRGSKLTIAKEGILATAKSGRICLLPWSNLKCVEITPAKINMRTGRLK